MLLAASPAPAQRWVQVSVGDDHACALDEQGRAYCWGNNHAGQLGACNTRPAPVGGGHRFRSVAAMPRGTMPTVYEMVGLTADGWTSVAAGEWGQCGVTTAGELFCWGRDPHEEVQGRIPHPAAP